MSLTLWSCTRRALAPLSPLPLLLVVACGGPLPSSPEPVHATVEAPAPNATLAPSSPLTTTLPSPAVGADPDERTDADRALDPQRHPAETVAFFGIAPGQHVAELGAGTGYTTEILARAVGSTGTVLGQNPKWLLERFAERPWSARLARPVMRNTTRLDREFDDPFPADVKDLDAVISVLFYHDTVWLKNDRDRMNRAVFAALKHGGVYGIIDHSARPGTGTRDVKTLHRIEEAFVVSEVERAGFKLAGKGDFLRNPTDPRDWNDAPSAAADKRGTSDRFVLKFVKP